MKFITKRQNTLLFSIQAVGAVFAGIFVTVYLAGLSDLPKDVVYHSDPVIRTSLSIIGTVLILIIIAVSIISYFHDKT